jgi:stage V sporulation protein D (sporulation-specific penicillin-binding protein)
VINQSPKAGARVEKGATIRIYMAQEAELGEHDKDHNH